MPVSTTPETTFSLGELASASDVTVATVKYYLREGLLPEGRLRSATRADYGPVHLERLRLLRLLREVGDVPVERLRALVAALSEHAAPGSDRLGVLAAGAEALTDPAPPPGPHAARAEQLAAELVERGGWTRCPEGISQRDGLRAALETVLAWEEVGLPVSADGLATYVAAADLVARQEIAALRDAPAEELLTQMVVGQVVYERLLSVLRRLAEAHHSAERWQPSGR